MLRAMFTLLLFSLETIAVNAVALVAMVLLVPVSATLGALAGAISGADAARELVSRSLLRAGRVRDKEISPKVPVSHLGKAAVAHLVLLCGLVLTLGCASLDVEPDGTLRADAFGKATSTFVAGPDGVEGRAEGAGISEGLVSVLRRLVEAVAGVFGGGPPPEVNITVPPPAAPQPLPASNTVAWEVA
jgi:hypothetical protein